MVMLMHIKIMNSFWNWLIALCMYVFWCSWCTVVQRRWSGLGPSDSIHRVCHVCRSLLPRGTVVCGAWRHGDTADWRRGCWPNTQPCEKVRTWSVVFLLICKNCDRISRCLDFQTTSQDLTVSVIVCQHFDIALSVCICMFPSLCCFFFKF